MTDLLSTPPAGAADLRGHAPDWSWLGDPADAPTSADLQRAGEDAERLLADHGVTYGTDSTSADGAGRGPWRLDPQPVTIAEAEWSALDAGLVQRAELLDAVLQDLYGPRRLLSDSTLPPTAVVGHPGFLRAMDGVRLPGGRELVLTATDLVRDGDGAWRAIADRTQAPSGAGYAMEGRRVVAQVLAGVYRQASIQRLGPFFLALRQALRDVAPHHVDVPRIALLTSGAASETAFDQAYLASMLGLPLVEGSDLLVREGRVWMRGVGGLEPVDVLLRRVDAEWCDPLDLRSGSRLGVPGLVRAVHGGHLSVVNPLGASVLENPAVLAYLPRLARTVLDQDLALPSAQTWWCGERTARAHVLDRLEELVVLPVAQGPHDPVLGWTLDAVAADELRRRIEAEPWRWAAQERVGGSDDPDGPQAAVLRTYAVAHRGSYTVMAGGLARVSRGPLVSSSSGAVAKDVWVLSSPTDAGPEPELTEDRAPAGRLATGISPRTAENLFWMGRYAERAEDQARDLRVAVDRWDDFHGRPRSVGGRALGVLLAAVAAMGAEDDGHDDAQPAAPARRTAGHQTDLRALVLDLGTGSTVARSIRSLGTAAAAVRDQLSTDTFGPLARVERALRAERNRARSPGTHTLDLAAALRSELTSGAAGAPSSPLAEVDRALRAERTRRSAEERALALPAVPITAGLRPLLDRVLEGLLSVAGIVAEGLVRDVGWRFLDAGRRIERAQHLVESLRSTVVDLRPTAVEASVIDALVLAHDSAITFRRRYPTSAGVPEVVELLVLAADNPRSLAFQVARLQEDLAEIPGRGTEQLDRLLADVADLLAELDPQAVCSTHEDGRRVRLAEALDSMLWRLRAAADEIERAHFVRPGALRTLDDPWDAADEVSR